MKRYRIVRGQAYNGCEPITVWWVQVKVDSSWSLKTWKNIKGFDTYERAEQLLEMLEN